MMAVGIAFCGSTEQGPFSQLSPPPKNPIVPASQRWMGEPTVIPPLKYDLNPRKQPVASVPQLKPQLTTTDEGRESSEGQGSTWPQVAWCGSSFIGLGGSGGQAGPTEGCAWGESPDISRGWLLEVLQQMPYFYFSQVSFAFTLFPMQAFLLLCRLLLQQPYCLFPSLFPCPLCLFSYPALTSLSFHLYLLAFYFVFSAPASMF